MTYTLTLKTLNNKRLLVLNDLFCLKGFIVVVLLVKNLILEETVL